MIILLIKSLQNIKIQHNLRVGLKIVSNYLEQYRMVILEDLLVEKLKIDLKSNNKEVNFSDIAKMQRK